MAKTIERISESKTIRLMMALILALGIAIPLGMTLRSPSAQAEPAKEQTSVPTLDTASVSDTVASATSSDPKATGKKILVRSILLDNRYATEDMTLDDVYAQDIADVAKSLVGFANASAEIYDIGDPSRYAVFVANAEANGTTDKPYQSYFCENNDNANMLDDKVTFDKESGIAFIDRAYVDSWSSTPEDPFVLRATECYLYDAAAHAAQPTSMLPVQISNDGETITKDVAISELSTSVSMQLVEPDKAADINPSDIVINTNDGASVVNGDNAAVSYDKQTGVLSIDTSGNINVASMDVSINKPAEVSTEADTEVMAIAPMSVEDDGVSPQNDTYFDGTQTFIFNSEPVVGQIYTDKSWVNTGTGGEPSFGSNLEVPAELADHYADFSDYWSVDGTPSAIQANYWWAMSSGTFLKDYTTNQPIGEWQDLFNATWMASSCLHPTASAEKLNTFFEDGRNWSDLAWEIIDKNDTTVTVMTITHSISAGQTQGSIVTFNYTTGHTFNLTKTSANVACTDGNANYSLEGAVYGIYASEADAKANKNPVQTITTDAAGKASTTEKLKRGNYWVREITPPKGYALDTTPHPFTIDNADYNMDVSDIPQGDPGVFAVAKADNQLNEVDPDSAFAQGNATLEGAEFTVRYYDGYYASPEEAVASGDATRTWVLRTNANGEAYLDEESKVSGDDFYLSENGKTKLPLGTIVVQETKAPLRGYFLGTDGTAPMQSAQITSSGMEETDVTFNAPIESEQVFRGDIELVKVREADMTQLAGIPFKITSKTTGESHIAVTDTNGYISTAAAWNAHTSNTNANDAAVTFDADGKATVDESKLNAEAGIWFNGYANKTVTVKDTLGALPYDDYTVVELPCKANEGLKLVERTVSISRNGFVIDMGTILDKDGPNIGTEASDGVTGTNNGVILDTVSIVDTVTYTGLTPGKEYTMTGTLMDKATGKELLNSDGKKITAETKFTPTTESGTVDVTFTFAGSVLSTGQQIVAFESCTQDKTEVAVHADINDEPQTITYEPNPQIGTTATDGDDGDHTAIADAEVTINDTVEYTGLTPGKEYTMTGTLMDKATGKELLVNGKPVTSSVKFRADTANGSVVIPFTFNGSAIANTDVVVFEECTTDIDGTKTPVAEHKDINDKGQTVTLSSPSSSSSTSTGAKYYDKTVDWMIANWPILLGCAFTAAAGSVLIRRGLKARNTNPFMH